MRFKLGIAGTRCFFSCFKLSFPQQTQVLTVELIGGDTDQFYSEDVADPTSRMAAAAVDS